MSRPASALLYSVALLVLSCSAPDASHAGDDAGAPALEAAAPAVPIPPESGFLDVPAEPSTSPYPARLFYSFRPADDDAPHKPIALFFNGGPGASTTAGLLSHGTGPTTLDPYGDASATPLANPASWTSFANLLYVDMRMSGFSYGLGAPVVDAGFPGPPDDSGVTGSVGPFIGFDPIDDASDFVHALLAFFVLHPSLSGNPVIFVGESYGGTRAQIVLDLVLRYQDGTRRGGELANLLQAHFDALFPSRAGEAFDPPTIATQFGAQVLIQPLAMGDAQYTAQAALQPNDPYVGPASASLADGGATDPYDVRQPAGWTDALDVSVELALCGEDAATAPLGVPYTSIPELLSAARGLAFRLGTESLPTSDSTLPSSGINPTLSTLLGPLDTDDSYFFSEVNVTYDVVQSYDVFLNNLPYVRTFITNARYDSVIYGPSIPAAIQAQGISTTVDEAPRAGVARPGWFTVIAPTDAGVATFEVRFPSYTSSGHMVAVSQAADLHDDVAAWLAGP